MHLIKKNFIIASAIFFLLLALPAQAIFNEPGSAPPTGNVEPPIYSEGSDQELSGGLNITSGGLDVTSTSGVGIIGDGSTIGVQGTGPIGVKGVSGSVSAIYGEQLGVATEGYRAIYGKVISADDYAGLFEGIVNINALLELSSGAGQGIRMIYQDTGITWPDNLGVDLFGVYVKSSNNALRLVGHGGGIEFTDKSLNVRLTVSEAGVVNVASGGSLQVNSVDVCLSDGTNCAAGTASDLLSVLQAGSDASTFAGTSIFGGNLELEMTTSLNTGVIYKGTDRFIHNFQHPTGSTVVPVGYNTFIGLNAGNFTMGSTATLNYHGSYNSALGYQALYSDTTGYRNSALGYQALRNNTSGANNSAFGYQALYTNSTGLHNSAVGYQALYTNSGGQQNSAMGYGALYYNSSGGYNSAFGLQALRNNTTGSYNLAFGNQALYSNNTGFRNSAIGPYALQSLTGAYHDNLALGYEAGRYQLNGTSLTTPSQSIYIGSKSRGFNNSDINSIVIGYSAIGIGANSVVLGNDSIVTTALKGKVGIGITDPNKQLHIKTASGNAEMDIQSASSPYWAMYQDDTTDDLRFWSATSDNLLTLSQTGGDTGVKVNGKNICLADGANCPAGSASDLLSVLNAGSDASAFVGTTKIGGNLTIGSITDPTKLVEIAESIAVYGLDPSIPGLLLHNTNTDSTGANFAVSPAIYFEQEKGVYNAYMGRMLTTYGYQFMFQYSQNSGTTWANIAVFQPDISTISSKLTVTEGLRLANKTTAQMPTCDSAILGTMIFDTTEDKPYVCASTGWKPLDSDYDKDGIVDWNDQDDTNANLKHVNLISDYIRKGITIFGVTGTMTTERGYFVMTSGGYNGRLSVYGGANQICLDELQANDWKGKNVAILDSSHVRAFLCTSVGCSNPLPYTTYNFARSGSVSSGGAYFTTGEDGIGPYNYDNWSGAYYFDSASLYWTGRSLSNDDSWDNDLPNVISESCEDWNTFNPSRGGSTADPNYETRRRWFSVNQNCNNTFKLICIVDPPSS